MTDEQRVKEVWPDAAIHVYDVAGKLWYRIIRSTERGEAFETCVQAWHDAASRLPKAEEIKAKGIAADREREADANAGNYWYPTDRMNSPNTWDRPDLDYPKPVAEAQAVVMEDRQTYGCNAVGREPHRSGCPARNEGKPAPQTFEHPRADCEGCGDSNCPCNLIDADGFMEWWRDNNQRFEASDAFTHPIDYAAAAWNAAKASSAVRTIWYHGTSAENAASIRRNGFAVDTWFARNMESAYKFGGSHIFIVNVTFDNTPLDWQVHSSNFIPASAIAGEVFIQSASSQAVTGGEGEYTRGFNDCREQAMRIVDESDGYLSRIEALQPLTNGANNGQ